MKKFSSFPIFIVTLCLVKSEVSNLSKETLRQKDVLNVREENISVSIVDENTLKDYENLVTLKLSGANVEEIRPGAFENNPKLKYIECDNNNLREIKSGVFKNLKLKNLSFKYTGIKILEKGAFQNLSVSGGFSLAGNKIEEIKKEVFDNINVESIDLPRNSISKLEVGVFDKVKTPSGDLSLWLPNNKLEKIDANVFNHKDIIFLNLEANQISELNPGDLQNMPKLEILRLSENKLTILSERVFSNLHLFRLDLSRNQISTIESGAFDGLNVSSDSRSSFDLSHNQLTKFDSNWFRNVFHGTGLIYLRFADNFIEKIPSQAFKNYPTVYQINLERNKIRNFAPDAFDGSKKIGNLLLAGNSIEKWNEDILAGRTDLNIDFLDLDNNKLKCFEGDLDQIFTPVGNVGLHGNPINATCVKKIRKCNKMLF